MRIAVAGGTGMVGQYVVHAAEARGHQVVILSRSRGVDLRTGDGVDQALTGTDAIVDVTNGGGRGRDAAITFFSEVAACLQTGAARHGVRHVVTLSIVGIDRPGADANAHYAAKLRQEAETLAGPAAASVLRATQFHEFAAQMMRRNREGALARVPDLWVQTVAARTVGEALVDLATQAPTGGWAELAGPQPASLVALAQAFARRWMPEVIVEASTPAGPPIDRLPSPGARIAGPPFEAWLDSDDAATAAR